MRRRLIGRVADHLVAREVGHPLRVAVDGITAAGKTTLANELAVAVEARGRPAIRISMDGFHHPRAHRYHRGRGADSYYLDAYDFPALARVVLEPLGPGGSFRFSRAVIDLATDQPVSPVAEQAVANAVLIVDGTFLQRTDEWDEVVYVETSFEQALARAIPRDAAQLGGADATREAYRTRYHAACRRYLAEVDPASHATVVIENSSLEEPVLQRIGRVYLAGA